MCESLRHQLATINIRLLLYVSAKAAFYFVTLKIDVNRQRRYKRNLNRYVLQGRIHILNFTINCAYTLTSTWPSASIRHSRCSTLPIGYREAGQLSVTNSCRASAIYCMHTCHTHQFIKTPQNGNAFLEIESTQTADQLVVHTAPAAAGDRFSCWE